MTVGELVNLDPILEMVRIEDYDAASIIKSSVFTQDLKIQLSIVLDRVVNRQEKNCFMVIGNYGSGKSHFLAFLGALFKEPGRWENFVEQLRLQHEPSEQDLDEELIQSGERLKDRRFFVVEYALDVVALPLSDVFYDRIRRALGNHGVELTFDQSEYDHRDRMEKVLSSISGIESYGENTALVVVFDEMADWLASKEGASLRADLAFLRSIGELSKTHKFMFFTSLQEDMLTPEHGHMLAFGDEVMRILERFEKITVVSQNVKRVASHRLLRKDREQLTRLQKLYSTVKKKLPLLGIEETEFCQLYPVHPLVFDVFERMLRYLSNRSVLLYISKSVKEMLPLPVDTLLTIDQLFLAHKDYLRSVPDCAPYVRIYDNLKEDVLPRVDDDVQEMARRALDAVVLLSMVDRNLTVTELANAILKAEYDGRMNYEALGIALKDLAAKSGQYFDIMGSGVDAVYKIVTTEGPDVESLIRTKAATLDDDDERIASITIASMLGEVLDKKIEAEQEVKDELTWRATNTRRPGKMWYVTKPIRWVDVEERLSFDTDFLLIIESPFVHGGLSRSEILDDRVALWRPSAISPSCLAHLKRDLAVRLLIRDKTGDENIVNILSSKLAAQKTLVRDAILEMYYREGEIGGAREAELDIKLFLDRSDKPKGQLFSNRFDELKSQLFDEALKRYYPEHPLFKATFTRTQSTRLISEFVKQKSAPIDGSTIASYVQNFAEPMDLCITAGEYLLNGESRYIRELEQRIEDARTPVVNLSALSLQLRQKPFGLPEPAFELLLAALYRLGKIILITSKGEKFPVSRFEEAVKLGFSRFEALEKSGMVTDPARLRDILLALGCECEPINSLEAQEKAWGRALTIPDQYRLDSLERELKSLPFATDDLLENMGKSGEIISPVLDELDPGNASKDAFEAILSQVDNVTEIKIAAEELRRLVALADDSFKLASASEYLQECACQYMEGELSEKRSALQNQLTSELAYSEKREHFFKALDDFKKGYVDEYVSFHEGTVGEFAPFDRIEKLKASEDFLSLKALSALRLQVEIPFSDISEKLTTLEGRKCDKLDKERLLLKPLCDCRFPTLGITDIEMETNSISKLIHKAISQYEKAILSEAETIKDNIENVESQEVKNQIQDFLSKKRLSLPVDDVFVRGLNQALEKIVVVEIDFTLLKTKMASETPLTWRKFMERLSEEIERQFPKGVSDETRIRVVVK